VAGGGLVAVWLAGHQFFLTSSISIRQKKMTVALRQDELVLNLTGSDQGLVRSGPIRPSQQKKVFWPFFAFSSYFDFCYFSIFGIFYLLLEGVLCRLV
jgi:hypothetical protein